MLIVCVFLYESMCPNHDRKSAIFESRFYLSFFFCAETSEEKGRGYTVGLKKFCHFLGYLCCKNRCRSHVGNLSASSSDPVKEREKSDNSFSGTDIPLKKTLHTYISFHILEYFKEGNFLMIRESKGESTDCFFYKISIKGDSLYMANACFLDDFLTLERLVLEFEKFFVGEFVFCEIVVFEAFWCMQSTDVDRPRAMFSDFSYFFG